MASNRKSGDSKGSNPTHGLAEDETVSAPDTTTSTSRSSGSSFNQASAFYHSSLKSRNSVDTMKVMGRAAQAARNFGTNRRKWPEPGDLEDEESQSPVDTTGISGQSHEPAANPRRQQCLATETFPSIASLISQGSGVPGQQQFDSASSDTRPQRSRPRGYTTGMIPGSSREAPRITTQNPPQHSLGDLSFHESAGESPTETLAAHHANRLKGFRHVLSKVAAIRKLRQEVEYWRDTSLSIPPKMRFLEFDRWCTALIETVLHDSLTHDYEQVESHENQLLVLCRADASEACAVLVAKFADGYDGWADGFCIRRAQNEIANGLNTSNVESDRTGNSETGASGSGRSRGLVRQFVPSTFIWD